MLRDLDEERALALHHRLTSCFPVTYQETVPSDRLSRDFLAVAEILDGKRTGLFDLRAAGTRATFTAIVGGDAVPLYVANPILEHLGVRLLQETSYDVRIAGHVIRIQDFIVESAHGEALDSDGIEE